MHDLNDIKKCLAALKNEAVASLLSIEMHVLKEEFYV